MHVGTCAQGMHAPTCACMAFMHIGMPHPMCTSSTFKIHHASHRGASPGGPLSWGGEGDGSHWDPGHICVCIYKYLIYLYIYIYIYRCIYIIYRYVYIYTYRHTCQNSFSFRVDVVFLTKTRQALSIQVYLFIIPMV